MIHIDLTQNQWQSLKKYFVDTELYIGDGPDWQKREHVKTWKQFFKERGVTYREDARASSPCYWGRVSFRNEKRMCFFILANPDLQFLFNPDHSNPYD